MEDRIFFIAGNETKSIISIFIENLLFYKETKKETPLFIETDKDIFFSSKIKQRVKDKELKMYDYYPELGITAITLEKLKSEIKNGKQEEFFKTEERFSSIFIYGEIILDTLPILALTDYLVIIIKNDAYSSGYLYKVLKLLKERNIYKKVLILISQSKLIEEAAQVFKKLKEEAEGMLGTTTDMLFAGFLSIDIKRLSFAMQKREPFIKSFPDSTFHGLIKYIDAKLMGLEAYVHDESFFRTLAERG